MGGEKGDRIINGQRQQKIPKGQENECKYAAVEGGVRWPGNQKKDPESWNVKGNQDSIGMTLAKMPKSGEVEPEETTSSS